MALKTKPIIKPQDNSEVKILKKACNVISGQDIFKRKRIRTWDIKKNRSHLCQER